MKFSPVLAAYGAVTVGVAVTGYLLFQYILKIGGGSLTKGAANLVTGAAGDLEDAVIFNPLGNYLAAPSTSTALGQQTDYLNARSAWFKAHGLSGTAAIARASMTDFPSETNWLSGQPFPAQ